MNDYEYEFKQDIKEKKSVGRNSRYMNRTGKGPIKFPSDYLSNKEKKKLNGSVISYDMGKPMSYEQLIMMPEDLQRLYLQGLMDKFHPSQRALAELFGCSKNRIAYRMREFGIKPAGESRGGKNPYFDAEAWDAWIADGKLPETTEPTNLQNEQPLNPIKPKMKEKKEVAVSETIKNPVIPVSVPEDKCLKELSVPKISDKIPFKTVAYLWSSYLTNKLMPLKPEDVAAMFAIIKIADISSGMATKEDWEELSGYALMASQLF